MFCVNFWINDKSNCATVYQNDEMDLLNYNPCPKFLEIYSALAQVQFTTSKMKLGNKIGVRVATQVAEGLHAWLKGERHKSGSMTYVFTCVLT